MRPRVTMAPPPRRLLFLAVAPVVFLSAASGLAVGPRRGGAAQRLADGAAAGEPRLAGSASTGSSRTARAMPGQQSTATTFIRKGGGGGHGGGHGGGGGGGRGHGGGGGNNGRGHGTPETPAVLSYPRTVVAGHHQGRGGAAAAALGRPRARALLLVAAAVLTMLRL